jgi:MoxR-like ATPase
MTRNVEGLRKVREEISRVIVGQEGVVELTLIALLCEGHVLLEGVPGLGKTLLVKTLADTLDLKFSRIQFTPDLMPADVIGTSMVMQDQSKNFNLSFEPGPIFANLVLGDEINRASPKTQSALLEAMQERTVTVRGEQYELPRPFLVLATENPLEMEGTYPLPEAQIDRFFFKILVNQPSESELETIIERTVGVSTPVVEPILGVAELKTLQLAVREVVAPPDVINYTARLVLATQPDQDSALARVKQFVRYGAGPRGAQSLILAAKARALMLGRFNVCLEDVQKLVQPSLRHRVALNFDGHSEGIKVDDLLNEIVTGLPTNKTRPKEISQ